MTKLTYTLEAETICIEDERILDIAGLKREESRGIEIEDGPFYFTTNSKDEIMNAIDTLDEENYELGWILTKKV